MQSNEWIPNAVLILGMDVGIVVGITGLVATGIFILWLGVTDANRDGQDGRDGDGARRPGVWLSLSYCIILAGLQVAVGFIAVGVGADMAGVLMLSTLTSLVLALVIVLSTYGSSFVKAMRLYAPRPLHAVLFLTLSIPILIVALRGGQLFESWFGQSDVDKELAKVLSKQSLLWGVFVLGVCPGIAEELLFRGCIGRGLVARLGIIPGVLVTSFLFGLIHVEPASMINAFILGIAFHLVYLASGTLLIPIILHALHNTMVLLFVRGDLPDLIRITADPVTGQSMSPAIWLPALLFVIAGVAVFVLTRRGWKWATPWSTGVDDLDDGENEETSPRRVFRLAPLACVVVMAGAGVAIATGFRGAAPDEAERLASQIVEADRESQQTTALWAVAEADYKVRMKVFDRFMANPKLFRSKIKSPTVLFQAIVGTDPRVRDHIATSYILPKLKAGGWATDEVSLIAAHLAITENYTPLALDPQRPDTFVDPVHVRPIVRDGAYIDRVRRNRYNSGAATLKEPGTDFQLARNGLTQASTFYELAVALPNADNMSSAQARALIGQALDWFSRQGREINKQYAWKFVAPFLERAHALFLKLDESQRPAIVDRIAGVFDLILDWNQLTKAEALLNLHHRIDRAHFIDSADQYLDRLFEAGPKGGKPHIQELIMVIIDELPADQKIPAFDRFDQAYANTGVASRMKELRLNIYPALVWEQQLRDRLKFAYVESATYYHQHWRSPRRLLELLKHPLCVDKVRDSVLLELKSYSGLDFKENIWDAVAKLHEAGIPAAEFYRPAKRDLSFDPATN